MVDKKLLKEKFSANWERHYKLNVLVDNGFERRKCIKCGRYFWSIEEREYCGDPGCIGYEFIGNPPNYLKLSYIDTWKKVEKYFVENGHQSIKPYPTVARWRDDLYFTIASINDFQPYVVKGEVDPIANPLIVPQLCIRFSDVDNVGLTGRHYTNFIMVGQHAFNNEKTGLFYWKEEAIGHDINYLTTALKIPIEEIIFHEDVWAGGGNFGPSMEYFVRGLELGNCVFMQYEELEDGSSMELKTKVIDMGAGLSRLAWITHGSPESYSIVYPEVVKYLIKETGVVYDQDVYLQFSKLAGMLNADERDIKQVKTEIAQRLGLDENYLFGMIEPLRAIFSIADHTMTLLQTITDGMMPSNSGGGYNLRMVARRMFSFEHYFGWEIDYHKILELHSQQIKKIAGRYDESVREVGEVILHEKSKWKKAKEHARKKVVALLSSKEEINEEVLLNLYRSEGIPPEFVKEEGEKVGIKVDIPENFYSLVREKDEVKKKRKEIILRGEYPPTEKLYYDNIREFEAVILGIENNYVILDRSAFYPEGGGQVGDTGYIDNVRVLDTKKAGNVVVHIVENSDSLSIGQRVKAKIDWERRVQISKNHTATHLITAAAREVLGKHVWQAGAKKDEEKAHIDLTHYKAIEDEELKLIEKLANRYVMRDTPIEIELLPRNIAESKYGFTIYQGGAVPGKELRIVKIEGIDVEACGGTHNVHKHTGELGFIKIIRRESVKDGVERLVFTAGEKAIEHVQNKENLLEKVKRVFRVNDEHLEKTALRFFEEWKERGKIIEKLLNVIKEEAEGKIISLPLKIKEFGSVDYERPTLILLNDGLIIAGKKAKDLGEEFRKELEMVGGGREDFYVLKGDYDRNKVIDLWLRLRI